MSSLLFSIFLLSPFLTHLFTPPFSSSPLSSPLTYTQLPLSFSPSLSSSSSSSLPSLPPSLRFPFLFFQRELLYMPGLSPLPSPSLLIQPLIRSIHYSIHRDMIR